GNQSIGFAGSEVGGNEQRISDILKHTEPGDLVQFGLIPEFIGRLPMMAVLNPLTQKDLEHVLLSTKNSLVKQFSKLFSMEGIRLEFSKAAIKSIADKAIALKTGARALRSIMEKIMLDIMYEIPSLEGVCEVHISPGVVEGTSKPKLKYNKGQSKAKKTPNNKKSAA
ncbi:MAG: ATP-dependent Clp protease ATP-binding subunit ClpX, partial [Puniceicoccaceae bacterium]